MKHIGLIAVEVAEFRHGLRKSAGRSGKADWSVLSCVFSIFRRHGHRVCLRSLVIFTGFLGSLLIGAISVLAGEPEGTVSFNIPAQPLQSALDAYGAATGLEVLYDSKLALGRRTKGLKGSFTPTMGLRDLLEGTRLTAIYAGGDSFAVVAAPTSRNNAVQSFHDQRYFGVIQSSIASAFCGDTEIQPGAYRVALKFWIGPDGRIRNPELLGSSRDPVRDQAVADALKRVAVDLPLPAGMPQPITMIIMPRPPQETGDCDFYKRESQ